MLFLKIKTCMSLVIYDWPLIRPAHVIFSSSHLSNPRPDMETPAVFFPQLNIPATEAAWVWLFPRFLTIFLHHLLWKGMNCGSSHLQCLSRHQPQLIPAEETATVHFWATDARFLWGHVEYNHFWLSSVKSETLICLSGATSGRRSLKSCSNRLYWAKMAWETELKITRGTRKRF